MVVADQGQYIHTCEYVEDTTPSFTWTKGNKTATWTSVAMVPDYRSTPSPKILATARDISGGIYISYNSGTTFTKVTTTSTSNMFTCVTVCGANTTYGAAAVGLNDYVYVSTDGALATWTAKTAFGKRDFFSIASIGDKDTMELLATDTSGNVWYSGDLGDTWSIKTPTPSFSCVTSDQSGTTVAATDSGLNMSVPAGDVWLSNNSGATWTVKDNNLTPPQRSWRYITYEPVNLFLWAIDGNDVFVSEELNSTGLLWNPFGPSVGSGSSDWTSITSSTNTNEITIVLTAQNSGSIWVYDATSTWTEQTTPGTNDWKCSALSSDGSRILVGASLPSTAGPLWRLLPATVTPAWVEKLNMGAVATYITSSSSYWDVASPTGINQAVNRIAFALYTAAGDTPIP